ncbi:MAG: hypothetical protein KAV87_09080 [Desulfobacteraceae bacterium]|nr:hypothetical protein [Desulfobacteraceae bacterium]
MQRIKAMWESGCLGKVLIGLIGFVSLSIICGVCGVALDVYSPPSEPHDRTEVVQPDSTQQVSSPTTDRRNAEIDTVSISLGSNHLGIEPTDLRGMDNPKGEGVFVYVEQTRFSGVRRFILWLVLDGNAYPLNGATKGVTPSLPWPREAPEEQWSRTNLDPYQATEAIDIVFDR